MKKINIILVLFLSTLIFTACNKTCDKQKKHKKEHAHTENTELNENVEPNTESLIAVEGMVCAKGCVGLIQDELNSINGVKSAKVNYEQEEAVIDYDSTLVTQKELIDKINTIADHKYKATLIKTIALDNENESVKDEMNQTEDA